VNITNAEKLKWAGKGKGSKEEISPQEKGAKYNDDSDSEEKDKVKKEKKRKRKK
jgi:hypothetical protein